MELTLVARDLLLVSWEVDPVRIARALPAGLEPQVSGSGRGLVSLVAYRNEEVRLDGRRAPAFSQVNVRTYVAGNEEAAIFLLSMRVTAGGLGGVLFGAPYRPAVIRIRSGLAQAKGLGLSCRYRVSDAAAEAPALRGGSAGSEQVAYYWAAGLRRVLSEHRLFGWRAAELEGTARFDPVLALGFDAGPPDSVVYAERTPFRIALPPGKVA